MQLGAFSNSLSVNDLSASIEFYTTLGFTVFHDQSEHNWVIIKNGDSVIGLFQGMFERNIMTFNPGWDHNASEVNPFDDVRYIQKHLKSSGIDLITQADETGEGPASCMVADPDGNMILIDQHR